MAQKVKLDDKEYDLDDLSDNGRAALASLTFATQRIQELSNIQALLERAKNSYIESIKKEMVAHKAGLLLEDE